MKTLIARLFMVLMLGNLSVLCSAADEAELAIKRLQSLNADAKPDELYAAFNEFCKAVFGAEKEPLVYDQFGKELSFMEGGNWVHVSMNSAVIAFESNLPASSTVVYGEGQVLGKKSHITERPYYVHVHYLKGLEPGKTYTYQMQLVDERGNAVQSEKLSFNTIEQGDAILVPGDMKTTPYRLDQSGATYILTDDITTSGAAIQVVGDNITLDLNGFTVRYGEQAQAPFDAGISAVGSEQTTVRYLTDNFRLVNGAIIQGESDILSKNNTHEKFIPLMSKGSNTEMAGVTIVYHAPQMWGANFSHPSGKMHIHHNVIVDKGAKITNRHGSATRSIGLSKRKREHNSFSIHHNLVKRTRQNGLSGATQLHNNEIYVDSFSTNSFAAGGLSIPGVPGGDLHHNRIMGTGFNPYGFGWAHEDYNVHNNLVHFQGILVNHRWHESWGDMSTLEAMRVTNYGKGGQVRNNLHYYDNLIVIKGRGGSELRGTGFFSDVSIKGLVFRDNVVKVIAEDDKTKQVSCIAAHGHTKKRDANPVLYKNNTLIGNRCIVRFGDSYGKGWNHHFVGNHFKRVGNVEDFQTVALGGAYTTGGHKFIDSQLGEGVSLDNVFWQRTSKNSHFGVGHMLTVQGESGATIEIKDKDGKSVFEGTIPAQGSVAVPLDAYIARPEAYAKGGEAKNAWGIIKDQRSPFTVTVGDVTKQEIDLTASQTLRF